MRFRSEDNIRQDEIPTTFLTSTSTDMATISAASWTLKTSPSTTLAPASSSETWGVVSQNDGLTFTLHNPLVQPSLQPNEANLVVEANNWDNWSNGKRAGVVFVTLLGLCLFVAYCFYRQCCCFRYRRARRNPPAPARAYMARGDASNDPYGSRTGLRNAPAEFSNVGLRGGDSVALSTVSPTISHSTPQLPARTLDPDAPPPSYQQISNDTIVPPDQHHRIAGQGHGEDEEFNVVADGKMPLSEIPFEDVDINALSSASSSSSAQNFREQHRARGGDTTGHTNS